VLRAVTQCADSSRGRTPVKEDISFLSTYWDSPGARNSGQVVQLTAAPQFDAIRREHSNLSVVMGFHIVIGS
jgi:hypothetical protein